MTDDQIDNLWLYRKDIHDGELMPQLRDLVRAALAAQPQAEPVAVSMSMFASKADYDEYLAVQRRISRPAEPSSATVPSGLSAQAINDILSAVPDIGDKDAREWSIARSVERAVLALAAPVVPKGEPK